ncbi:hypothetical protein JKP88DRAFT_253620 [Tribonema minus]|uniref:Uncharacterized protein n=1 Tax=Tribonema minus TaxID=303371 RepID=A0A835ZFY3_9STRA|nr:hypothetical protein JKP88DRAFT_253620 [Tribonema minus]
MGTKAVSSAPARASTHLAVYGPTKPLTRRSGKSRLDYCRFASYDQGPRQCAALIKDPALAAHADAPVAQVLALAARAEASSAFGAGSGAGGARGNAIGAGADASGAGSVGASVAGDGANGAGTAQVARVEAPSVRVALAVAPRRRRRWRRCALPCSGSPAAQTAALVAHAGAPSAQVMALVARTVVPTAQAAALVARALALAALTVMLAARAAAQVAMRPSLRRRGALRHATTTSKQSNYWWRMVGGALERRLKRSLSGSCDETGRLRDPRLISSVTTYFNWLNFNQQAHLVYKFGVMMRSHMNLAAGGERMQLLCVQLLTCAIMNRFVSAQQTSTSNRHSTCMLPPAFNGCATYRLLAALNPASLGDAADDVMLTMLKPLLQACSSAQPSQLEEGDVQQRLDGDEQQHQTENGPVWAMRHASLFSGIGVRGRGLRKLKFNLATCFYWDRIGGGHLIVAGVRTFLRTRGTRVVAASAGDSKFNVEVHQDCRRCGLCRAPTTGATTVFVRARLPSVRWRHSATSWRVNRRF